MVEKVWYCPTCDRLFDDRDITYSDELEVGYSHRICVACGTWDELEEAEECEICGEPIKPNTHYCNECIQILKVGLEDTKASLDCKEDVFREAIAWLWENEDVWREDEREV